MTTTHQNPVYLKDLHIEHRQWVSELNFVKDEIAIFTHRLSEIEVKNNGSDFRAEAESFQNRLIRQKEVLDELLHGINAHESFLAHNAIDHPIAIDHIYFQDHKGLREKMTRFSTLYAEFKTEFMRFTAKWM